MSGKFSQNPIVFGTIQQYSVRIDLRLCRFPPSLGLNAEGSVKKAHRDGQKTTKSVTTSVAHLLSVRCLSRLTGTTRPSRASKCGGNLRQKSTCSCFNKARRRRSTPEKEMSQNVQEALEAATPSPPVVPPTPYRRDNEEILPHTSFMSGNVHIQAYDLRLNKTRPRRLVKPYQTIKTERQLHNLLGSIDPPPLRGPYETIRTVARLDEVLAEERNLHDIERYYPR